MPINQKLYDRPALRGDISGIAIDLTIALDAITRALEKISEDSGVDISKDLAIVRESSKSVTDNFDQLVGWTDDAD